jgi:hypothetical protein
MGMLFLMLMLMLMLTLMPTQMPMLMLTLLLLLLLLLASGLTAGWKWRRSPPPTVTWPSMQVSRRAAEVLQHIHRQFAAAKCLLGPPADRSLCCNTRLLASAAYMQPQSALHIVAGRASLSG